MLNRKVKKLIRDPKLFFSDMVKKQEKKIKTLKKIQIVGGYKFTIVSAVYNAETYLEDFFKSLTSQSLNFKKHIKIILVDDGSQDNSFKVIKKWCQKYPDNIFGMQKENGGQASARNLGLTKVDTEWVGFIDPDDFVNKEYFATINSHIENNKTIDIVSCKMIVYKEESKTFADTQPLKFCFEKNETLRNCSDLEDLIQLSASSALFKTKVIKENDIIFNHEIKPNFEDGKFVIDYMGHCTGKIAFLNQANYYYRVRGDNSSTTNTQWEKVEKYSNVLEYGLLAMLKEYHQKHNGKVPRFAQRTALYFLIQYYNRILNNESSIDFLTVAQKQLLLIHLDDIFNYIDDNEILKFNLLGAWFFHKVGMQALFKSGTGYNFQIAYIKNFDAFKNEVQISYFCKTPALEEIKIDGIQVIPNNIKTIKHDFLGRVFIERLLWVKFNDVKQNLSINLHKNTDISVIGQNFKGAVSLEKVKNIFYTKSPTKNEDSNVWLFMDSDTRADDNAEHLYRYVSKFHPEINSIFVLRKSSKDWGRLAAEGFNLVDFDTPAFQTCFDKAGVLLSSHIDKCFTQYKGKYSLAKKKFIFLQHGVTKDNISSWLNNTSRIDAILTSTYQEYDSLSNSNSPYNFDARNVLLTGMPRYDNLISISKKNSISNILIMPTWRRDLVGKTLKHTSGRSYNPELRNSDYFVHWQSVISSDELKSVAVANNLNVVFMPHPNLVPYINEFEIPNYIEIVKCDETSVQNLISKTKLLLTDYSSIAFDVALSGGKCIYYQFDENEVFSGKHTYSRGYYDYKKDGFGPVAYNSTELFYEMKNVLEENVSSSYNQPQNIFSHIDEKNCERAVSAILNAISPEEITENSSIIYEYANMAVEHKNWELALHRWSSLLSDSNEFYHEEAKKNIIKILLKLNKVTEAIQAFSEFFEEDTGNLTPELLEISAKIKMLTYNWQDAVSIINSLDELSDDIKIFLLHCQAELHDISSFESIIKESDTIFNIEFEVLLTAFRYLCLKQWNDLAEFLTEKIDLFSESEHLEFKPYLLLSRAYQEIGELDQANVCLQRHESLDKGNILLRYQIASLASKRKQWAKVTTQISATNIPFELIPLELLTVYIRALRYQGKQQEALQIIDSLSKFDFISTELLIEVAELHFELKNWNLSAETWMKVTEENDLSYYKLAFIYRRLGMIEEGLSLLLKKAIRTPLTLEEWILRAELAELVGEWDEAIHSWSSILRYHSENAPDYCWERLSNCRILRNISSFTGSIPNRDNNNVNRI
ncbi:CDP-glycerol glycerophosphotransferase family protein [Rahnella variigena]|uniref:CDP-glycerol glycerophosphotransferase family protein n=1 Tax=Rahnella variigena TaxID=574964 RepID=UPI003D2A2F3F